MKAAFCDLVEYARVRQEMFASSTGDRFGLFMLKHPRTGKKLEVMVVDNAFGWDHVSVSLNERCPTWDEMCWVKSLFFDGEETVVQFHPPVSKHVNVHVRCLHLWRAHDVPFPMPPEVCV